MQRVTYLGDKEDILTRVTSADIMVSDFDGTDVRTPLKRAVMGYLSSPHNILRHPGLVSWGFKALVKKAMDGKDAESFLWQDLTEILGEDTEDMIEKLYESEKDKSECKLGRCLLPGVRDLYEQLSDANKFYISRNSHDIISLYAPLTGVTPENIHTGARKEILLEDIIANNPGKRYLIRGDSRSDSEVADVADFYKRKGQIDDYVAIAIGDSSHSSNENVDVVVSDDQRGLVEDLREHKRRPYKMSSTELSSLEARYGHPGSG